MKCSHLALLGALAVALSGCGNLMSIYRDDSLITPGGHVVSMDAKQRSIISNRTRSGTAVYRRYCSEPAPDALTALSVGASGDLGAAALSSSDPEVRMRAAFSAAEAAGTIERTQTINVLREMMFRTCERYLNGSIGDQELIIQAARDQRTIVSVLAIEQLTRTVRSPSTVLVAGSAGATYSDPTASYDLLVKAEAAAKAADKDYAAAKTRFDDLAAKANAPKCAKPIYDDPKKKDDDPEEMAYAACKQLLDAQDDQDIAHGNVDFYKGLAERATLGLTTQAGLGARFEPGGANTAPPEGSIEAVASAVRGIVGEAYEFDEFEMTCVARLRAVGQEVKAEPANALAGTKSREFIQSLALSAGARLDPQSLDGACLNYLLAKKTAEIAGTNHAN